MNQTFRDTSRSKASSLLGESGPTVRPFDSCHRHGAGEWLTRLFYRLWPGHLLGELLSKSWTETAIPMLVLIVVALTLSKAIPGFLDAGQLASTARQAGEIGLVVLGLALVMIVGGIDLSVGSIFALTNFTALYCMNILRLPVAIAIPATIAMGITLGAVNGVLIGYFRLRAFLTTLITLIIYRAVYELLIQRYSTDISSSFPDSKAWDFIGSGSVLGIPTVVFLLVAIALFGHVFLTRMRHGWHITAIGGSRRSARNSGIAVRSVVTSTYVASGGLTAAAAVFFASRLSTVGGDIGVGLEVTALTAAVLGGISLGGGKGSVTKALVGTLIVLLITNGLTALSFAGGVNRMVLSAILILAAALDIRWNKNRQRIINSVYVSPTYVALPPSPPCGPDTGTVWETNNRLRDVEAIGLGEVEGPEDVILDRAGNLYSGSRHGDIMRFLGPDYKQVEVFAHIGGSPLGMAFDRDENLYVCVGGMGLYRVTPQRVVEKCTDETRRSWGSISDDSRLRLADDLDIAPDGRVFFSEATVRYEMHDWALDVLEARGNGRIICYDPRNKSTTTVLSGLEFPNGVSIGPDGVSILFAQSSVCRVMRYWFDGPRKGEIRPVIANLPGIPDNINLASDGNYWLALTGMRTPAMDLALRMPGFRKRMTRRLPIDEWLFPNINIGCVVKFTADGEILETLWDQGGVNHPMITSMREHKGWLYLGGLSNNRIGRIKLEAQADPDFVHHDIRGRHI